MIFESHLHQHLGRIDPLQPLATYLSVCLALFVWLLTQFRHWKQPCSVWSRYTAASWIKSIITKKVTLLWIYWQKHLVTLVVSLLLVSYSLTVCELLCNQSHPKQLYDGFIKVSCYLNDPLLPYVSLVLLSSQHVVSFVCVCWKESKREKERQSKHPQAVRDGGAGSQLGTMLGFKCQPGRVSLSVAFCGTCHMVKLWWGQI